MLSIRMTIEPAPAEERKEQQQQLLRIAGGEREALAELYQHTRLAVYGLALSYLKNVQDAQDLTQDVYVQVWNCAEQYCPSGSPIGWLLTVCRNLCLMHLRREKKNAALSEEEWNAIPVQECGLDADERALLQHALALIGEEERRIVLLHAVTGMKYREIAALLEMPLATVLSKYHRALKKMRIFLEGDDAR
ncbi:RNA polymerase sigma factor [Fusicatenibacter sp.]